MEEDLHMALCVVKVLALVVIAASLWSISGSVSGGSGFGFATDGFSSPVISAPNNAGSASYLGPNRSFEGSAPSGPFANRYEAPVFWNIGDINKYEEFQAGESKNKIKYEDPVEPSTSGGFRGNFGLNVAPKGYFGLNVAPKGYMGIPGIPTTVGTVSPY